MLRQALFEKLKPDAKEWIAAAKFLMKARREPSMLNIESAPRGATRPTLPSVVDRNLQKSGGCEWGPSKPAQGLGRCSTEASCCGTCFRSEYDQTDACVAARRRDAHRPPMWRMPYDLSSMVRPDLSPPPMASMSALFQLLMPRDVQMVPLSLIGAVLAAYIVVIGPVDYFVLGLLRMRRLTWILFPVVTIAFAVFTLFLSRWYLGTNDSRQAIEINDIVKGGTTARRTRIELLFLSRAREVGTDVQNGAFSQVAPGDRRGSASAGDDAFGRSRARSIKRSTRVASRAITSSDSRSRNGRRPSTVSSGSIPSRPNRKRLPPPTQSLHSTGIIRAI